MNDSFYIQIVVLYYECGRQYLNMSARSCECNYKYKVRYLYCMHVVSLFLTPAGLCTYTEECR